MVSTKAFFEKAVEMIDKAAEAEKDNIYKAAAIMGDCMNENGVVQLFGLDHGKAFSMELGYRAGGLMPFHKCDVQDLALRGVISEAQLKDKGFNHDPEMAHKLMGMYRIEKEDMFILVSFSGCEAIIVEAAKMAKANGQKVIAVVSKALSDVTESTHPSKEKLVDLADLVIDNHADVKDVVLDVDGVHKINQTATITGNVIAQMLTAETYRYLTEKGLECPVLLSANIKGADVHNRKLSDKYAGRWNS